MSYRALSAFSLGGLQTSKMSLGFYAGGFILLLNRGREWVKIYFKLKEVPLEKGTKPSMARSGLTQVGS